MKNLVFILLACLCSFTAFSQYTITGKVLNADSGDAIAGATILLVGTDRGTITHVDGSFSIQAYEENSPALIRYIGYLNKELTLSADDYSEILLEWDPSIDPNSIVTSCCPDTMSRAIDAVKIEAYHPFAYSTVTSSELKKKNLGQDVPILLNNLTSVTTTSDAGAGIGYTGINVRGSDASRTNVTINGIPLNDSESAGTFWVDLPDFAANVGSISLVRGAGMSTNGAGAFGASLHLNTQEHEEKAYANYNASLGSFKTVKNSIEFGTGKFNDKLSFEGRLSKITSDGYIDRASSDLQSYYLSADYDFSEKSSLEFMTFSGHEVTYQAWNGVPEALLETDRTFNVYDYENQVDDYKQDHYQLHFNSELSESWAMQTALHYTKGLGFFEQFREGDDLADYGIADQIVGGQTISESDLVRRRWLDNDFYGITASVSYFGNADDLVIGTAVNNYDGDHFGEVISGQFVPTSAIGQNYYDNTGTKSDGTIYAKYTRELDNGLIPYVDLQYRRVGYEFLGKTVDGSGSVIELPQNVSHNFFNPKLGVSAYLGQVRAYASYSRAQKEPNRSDYTDSPANQLPKHEKLNDFELGARTNIEGVSIGLNLYNMLYKDQLTITGGVNDVGEYTRTNVEDSYRRGIELDISKNWSKFSINGNVTLSSNKVKSFVEQLDNFDTGIPDLITHENTDLALSPNLVAFVGLEYALAKDVELTWGSKYVGDQFLDNTSAESRMIDSYFRNDLGVNASLLAGQDFIKGIDINLQINNILGEVYETNGYTFGYIYGGQQIFENYYYPQAGRHLIGGMRVQF